MADKSAGESAVPAKIPQKHGGALYAGGVPGNVGGPGRPPSELRQRLRGSFSDRLTVLEEIADGEAVEKIRLPDGEESEAKRSAAVSDRLKALDLMAKYGLGANKGHDEALIAKLGMATAEVFAGDDRLPELHRRWVALIGAHVRGDEP